MRWSATEADVTRRLTLFCSKKLQEWDFTKMGNVLLSEVDKALIYSQLASGRVKIDAGDDANHLTSRDMIR